MQDAEVLLQTELEPGEALEWAGRPGVNALAVQQLPKLAFALVWSAGVGYSFFNALISKAPVFMAVIPLSMLAFGFFFLWGAAVSLMAAWQTFYGVTNRRLLVLELGIRRRITSWTPQQITFVERLDRGNGRGDVIFHQSQQPSADGSSLVSASLVDVAEVRAVEACIRRLAAS